MRRGGLDVVDFGGGDEDAGGDEADGDGDADEDVAAGVARFGGLDALDGFHVGDGDGADFQSFAGEAELDGWRRSGGWIALALVDVDRFKDVNDRLGHAAGDRALADIAGILRRWGRRSDVLARVGGDEFAVLMPGTDADEATAALARIRGTMRELQRSAAHLEPLSLSVGIAAMAGGGEDVTLEDLMHRADQALYRAKEAGRDRIEVAP